MQKTKQKITYRLGFLVFFNGLVRRVHKVHLRTQFWDNKVAASTQTKQTDQ